MDRWTPPGPTRIHLDRDTGKLAPRPDEAPVPQKALELYVNDRLGAKAIATRLNEQGHRNKGKPYHADSVLNMHRSRTYLGEVYFRGTWYRAENHHEPLVDPDLFEQAQQILIARGDEHAKRAQVNSDYTLAGLVTCANCGKRYLGTPPRATPTATTTTPATPGSATEPKPAPPNGSPPNNSNWPSSTP